jgi:hypothetical protein
MEKPREHQYPPMNKCACGREKKVMSKYCVSCSSDINRLRVLVRTGKKTTSQEAEMKLKDVLAFH